MRYQYADSTFALQFYYMKFFTMICFVQPIQIHVLLAAIYRMKDDLRLNTMGYGEQSAAPMSILRMQQFCVIL